MELDQLVRVLIRLIGFGFTLGICFRRTFTLSSRIALVCSMLVFVLPQAVSSDMGVMAALIVGGGPMQHSLARLWQPWNDLTVGGFLGLCWGASGYAVWMVGRWAEKMMTSSMRNSRQVLPGLARVLQLSFLVVAFGSDQLTGMVAICSRVVLADIGGSSVPLSGAASIDLGLELVGTIGTFALTMSLVVAAPILLACAVFEGLSLVVAKLTSSSVLLSVFQGLKPVVALLLLSFSLQPVSDQFLSLFTVVADRYPPRSLRPILFTLPQSANTAAIDPSGRPSAPVSGSIGSRYSLVWD